MTVLSEISPEHIAEMTYVDDYDTTIGKIGSQNALFIVLKPGIDYDPGRGSFVAAESPRRDTVAAAPTLPEYRYRGSPVRIKKVGYEELNIAVEISPETAAPITLTMAKRVPK